MFALVITTIIFAGDGQERGRIESVTTESVVSFADHASCQAAAGELAGTVFNVERQVICVALEGGER
jgi:hypothetical protein